MTRPHLTRDRELLSALPSTAVERRVFVLGTPLEIEGTKHRNIDAETSKHELDGAKHEGGE